MTASLFFKLHQVSSYQVPAQLSLAHQQLSSAAHRNARAAGQHRGVPCGAACFTERYHSRYQNNRTSSQLRSAWPISSAKLSSAAPCGAVPCRALPCGAVVCRALPFCVLCCTFSFVPGIIRNYHTTYRYYYNTNQVCTYNIVESPKMHSQVS